MLEFSFNLFCSGGAILYGSDDKVDGRETVGKSLRRGPLGGQDGSDDRVDGREIAWGELCWEGAGCSRGEQTDRNRGK